MHYALYGIEYREFREKAKEPAEVLVAIFTTRELAYQYILDSEKANRHTHGYVFPYEESSLLSNFVGADIQQQDFSSLFDYDEGLLLDPQISIKVSKNERIKKLEERVDELEASLSKAIATVEAMQDDLGACWRHI